MKARLPKGVGSNPGNVQGMLKKAQQVQDKVNKLQEELDVKEYPVTVGGGVLSVTVNGKHELTAIDIKPEIVDPNEIDMLKDLIMSAVNEAIRTAEADGEEQMDAITGGMNIPGLGF